VNIKFKVNTRIVFNGKEYGSPEELPENVREAYGKATAAGDTGAHAPQAHARVRFNGLVYENVEDMPPEARRLYDAAMALVEKEKILPQGSPAFPVEISTSDAAPITPDGASLVNKVVLVLLAVGAAVVMLFVLLKVFLSAH